MKKIRRFLKEKRRSMSLLALRLKKSASGLGKRLPTLPSLNLGKKQQALLGVLVALVAALAISSVASSFRKSTQYKTVVEAQISNINRQNEVGMAIINGCASKLQDPGRNDLMVVVALTGGQACLQLTGSLYNDTLEYKGVCNSGSSDCAFVAAYTSAAYALEEVSNIDLLARKAELALKSSKN